MGHAHEILSHLEALLVELQQIAWQQRAALVALRVGAVEAMTARQQLLLQELHRWQEQMRECLEHIEHEAELRRRWERLKVQAAELRRLLQLNRFLAQRAQQHTAALLEILVPHGYLYNQQA
ncbi:hypothetical protein HRbin21_00955 [bacterium HR21]|jgi:flagellar biosynthesis/type III secretory pathway chaperone|nr:hypothetical protein HRbin21_00955 [bacterium HR21]